LSESVQGAPDSSNAVASAGARPAAHGVVFLTASQATMVVCGYLIHSVATRLLGPPSYGRLALVFSVTTWLKCVQAHLLVAGYQKVVSEDHRRIHAAFASGRTWYTLATVALLAAYAGAVPLLVRAFGDARLTWFLLLAAVEIPFYAALCFGRRLVIGVRHYAPSAAVMMIYAVVRAGAACALLYGGLGVRGAIMGQILGSLAGGVVAIALCLRVRSSIAPVPYPAATRRALAWTSMELPTALCLMTVVNIDLWFVKALVPGDALVGLYGSAYALSRLPQFAVFGMGAAVFPRVSGALHEGKRDLAQSVARQALRVCLLLFIALSSLVASAPSEIATLFFSEKYAAAGAPLMILMASMSCFGLLWLSATLVAATGHLRLRLAIVAALLPVGVVLCRTLIPRHQLIGGAVAALITLAIGAVAAAILLYRYLAVAPPGWTLLRCALAGAAVFFVGRAWPAAGALLVVKMAVLGALYLVILLVLREIRRDDWHTLRRLLPGASAGDGARPGA